MSHPENAAKKTKQTKKTDQKKPLAERMAGKKPFDWLKVDPKSST